MQGNHQGLNDIHLQSQWDHKCCSRFGTHVLLQVCARHAVWTSSSQLPIWDKHFSMNEQNCLHHLHWPASSVVGLRTWQCAPTLFLTYPSSNQCPSRSPNPSHSPDSPTPSYIPCHLAKTQTLDHIDTISGNLTSHGP